MGLAEKLLKKMGWRQGEGLGRNRQGISTPLMAQKRGDHAAVIVSAPEVLPLLPDGGEVSEGAGWLWLLRDGVVVTTADLIFC